MLCTIQAFIITLIITAFTFADVFMTELTDPQNSSDAGRYVELYNNGDSDVDLSTGWIIQRWTNGNADPTASSIIDLTGTISAGGFFIICNDTDKFSATYGITCDQDIGTGGAADSNGDDNMAILDAGGVIVDMFGVAGEDGSGTGHEFEDGRAERAEGVTAANATWNETEWNIDNDSGGGDGNQYAPEGFDPGAWIGATSGGDSYDDETACNTGADGACEYPDSGYDCDGNCVGELDCAGTCGGDATEDCAGVCGGDAVEDECGECGGDGSSCAEPPANLFFSEYAEGSSNNKYLEIYNATDGDVDLGGYSLSSCSNGCNEVGAWDYPDNVGFEAGTTIISGDVYVVCHGSSDELILTECDQTHTYLSNGDDVFALTQIGSGAILDVIGLVGDDPGSGWDVAGVTDATKDHTLVRKTEVTTGNPLWLDNTETGEAGSAGSNADDSEWLVFDQNTWDYIGSHPHDFSTAGCMDETACNYDANASSDDGTCLYNDCVGECGGSAEEDDCGICEGDGSSCLVNVTFTVDMSIEGIIGDIKLRTSTENGEYDPSDWYIMDDAGDGVYSYTLTLSSGITYGYNFNNSDESGYESGDGLGNCAGGTYGNDRFVTPGDSDITLDTVCWESCDACPEDIPGCMDETALNYDENATEDDGSCIYDWPEAANLFISEYAEGSSNNKYLEIFNATEDDLDLSGYSLSSCSNGCNETDVWDYPDNVTFEAGTIVTSGDVYVVCHGSADDLILVECDQTFTYLSNGDDVFALTQIGTGTILDIIGTTGDDPGSGWEVAGVSNGTKDHTLVRNSWVLSGNSGNWEESAGDAEGSEWEVYDQNTWDYIGFHEFDEGEIPPCAQDCEGIDSLDDVCGGLEDEEAQNACFCDWFNGIGGPEASCFDDCEGDVLDEIQEIDADCADGGECTSGDVNGDGDLNVLDIVVIVGYIVDGLDFDLACADANGDGAVNVLDIVALVNDIVNPRSNIGDATSAKLIQSANGLTLKADGYIGGIQMTLKHENDFSIKLSDNAWISDYSTHDNQTILVLVNPENGGLFTTSSDFEIVDMIVANSQGAINTAIVGKFSLSEAYPNPFNPSTSVELMVPEAGHVSVMVYNLTGQLIAKLVDANLNANNYQFTWRADNTPSGMYLLRAEYAGQVSTQKLMLLK